LTRSGRWSTAAKLLPAKLPADECLLERTLLVEP
jgi:hypothetical protein